MVQLRIQTAMQEDYVRNLPFHVVNPTPPKSGGQANPPLLATVGDAQGRLNIFHVLQSDVADTRKLRNIYFDPINDTWVEDDTGWVPPDNPSPVPGVLRAAKHPVNGTLHVALAHTTTVTSGGGDISYQVSIYYLNLASRYPKWLSTTIDSPSFLGIVPSVSMDLAFREGTTPLMTISISTVVVSTDLWNSPAHSRLWTWAPSEGDPVMSTFSIFNIEPNPPPVGVGVIPMTETIRNPVYGLFPAQQASQIEWGWYWSSYNGSGPGPGVTNTNSGNGEFMLRTTGPQPADTTCALGWLPGDIVISGGNIPIPSAFRSTPKCYFAPDASASPLLFSLRTTSEWTISGGQVYDKTYIAFIQNNMFEQYSYDNRCACDGYQNSEAYQLFGDVVGTPVWFDVSYKAATTTNDDAISWGLNVFAVFEVSINGNLNNVELWHTQTLDDAVVEVQDGMYFVNQSGWSASSRITTNVFSTLQCPYLQSDTNWDRMTSPNGYSVSVSTINGSSTCTVLGQDLAFHVWEQQTDSSWSEQIMGASSASDTSSIPATKISIYTVDVTALDDNNLPVPYLKARFGTKIATIVEVNGISKALMPGQSLDLELSMAGRCGLNVQTFGSLIPDTFWLWVDGMDDDAQVEIQPAAQDLHIKLQTCTESDMKLIAGDGVPVGDLSAAAASLQNLSTIITGPNTTDALEGMRSEYVHHSTSPHVARSNRQTKLSYRLGHLPVGYDLSFHISFKDKLECTRLSQAEAEAMINARTVESVSSVLGIDWGDAWENVKSGVYAVKDAIVTVGKDGVNALIEGVQIVGGALQWAWHGIIQLATEAADIAGAVFDYIKATWEKIKDWLGFLFDWDDIKSTANVFKGLVHTSDQAVLNFVNNTLAPITDSFFDNARKNLAGWSAGATTNMGSDTPGQFSSVSTATSPDSGISWLDILDALPSPGMWLFNKLMGVIEDVIGSEFFGTNSDGVDDFTAALNLFMDTIASQQNEGDFTVAIQALEALLESVVTQGLFNGITFANLIAAGQALAVIGLDLAETLISVVIKLLQIIATQLVSFLEDPIDIPGISWLYETITNDTAPNASTVICFVIAIPFTIIFKTQFNVAPWPAQLPSKSDNMQAATSFPLDAFQHAVAGVAKLLFTAVGVVGDISRLSRNGKPAVGMGKMEIIYRRLLCRDLPPPSLSGSKELNVAFSAYDPSPVDITASTLGYVELAMTIIRICRWNSNTDWGRKPGASADREEDIFYGVQSVFGVGELICACVEAASGPSNDHDKTAIAALFTSSIGNMGLVMKCSFMNIYVKIAGDYCSLYSGLGVGVCDLILAGTPSTTSEPSAKQIGGVEDEAEEI